MQVSARLTLCECALKVALSDRARRLAPHAAYDSLGTVL